MCKHTHTDAFASCSAEVHACSSRCGRSNLAANVSHKILAGTVGSTEPDATDFFVRRWNHIIHYCLSISTDSFLGPKISDKFRKLSANSLAHTVNGDCYIGIGFDECATRLRVACAPSLGPRVRRACFIRFSFSALFNGVVDGPRNSTSPTLGHRGILEFWKLIAWRFAKTVNKACYCWIGANRRDVVRSVRSPTIRVFNVRIDAVLVCVSFPPTLVTATSIVGGYYGAVLGTLR